MYVSRRRSTQPTRERIMASVREQLEEGAFHGSTVEEVAARAGVSRATLYQHFGSRLGLVDALCETFSETPALVAIRTVADVEGLVRLSCEFWAAEEKILAQLYGVAAVDPAARDLVDRQRRDRYAELRRVLAAAGAADAFAELAVLTSFETFEELRRSVGLSQEDVVRTLQAAAARLTQTP